VKYRILRDCDWQTFAARTAADGQPAAEIDAADLKTADGKPLPAEVVGVWLGNKALVPVEAPAATPE
jgi:hypothetical protein